METKNVASLFKELSKRVKSGEIHVNILVFDSAGKLAKKVPVGKGNGKNAPRVKLLKKRGRKKLNLPVDRDIYRFLQGKIDGETLASVCSEFKVKKDVFLPKLARLVKRGDLGEIKGSYFLLRRVRNLNPQSKVIVVKRTPIVPGKLLECLKKTKGGTLPELAKKMNEPTFHRLIKPINKLVKDEKVVRDGKVYRLA
ncbi:MAG: hypothetical protein ACD_28C00121G0001 [uncultured bacterium]|nr:MAG: hypothetical protein ACD_28C00121G0001 [uncultured bacterium]